VLQRNDGTPAYNLAVVIDDDAQGITEVVRGDDLLTSTPRQLHLQRLLGLASPTYAHVPLVIGPDGQRLAKRHGAVTLGDWHARGRSTGELVGLLARSIGCSPVPASPDLRAADVVDSFSWSAVPRTPWTWPDPLG